MIAPDGTRVVINDNADRRRRFCQCSRCGTVKRCTPENDFYTTVETNGLLLCQECFDKYCRTYSKNRGAK